mmetsp:Transcript_22872/g.53534  ORF Transcript_22872/g.53534 Transcript_22872/m.53534 type:complete len:221 (+) Transcript_22872:285-947(+)
MPVSRVVLPSGRCGPSKFATFCSNVCILVRTSSCSWAARIVALVGPSCNGEIPEGGCIFRVRSLRFLPNNGGGEGLGLTGPCCCSGTALMPAPAEAAAAAEPVGATAARTLALASFTVAGGLFVGVRLLMEVGLGPSTKPVGEAVAAATVNMWSIFDSDFSTHCSCLRHTWDCMSKCCLQVSANRFSSSRATALMTPLEPSSSILSDSRSDPPQCLRDSC